MKFDFQVVGEEAVLIRLNGISNRIRQEIVKAITGLTLKLQSHVKSGKLSGQVLKVRTGTLRRSIDQKVTDNLRTIKGKVSTNLRYGFAHEYGWEGTQNVKEHLRTIKQAWGKPIEPVTATVKAHARHVKIPEKSFLRSALKDFISNGEIKNDIEAAVKRGLI